MVSFSVPKLLYHATFRAFLPSIREKGLIINSGNVNWLGMVEDKAIYLASDYNIAEEFCESADNVADEIYNSGIEVLVIDTTKLNQNKLGIDKNILLEDDENNETFAYYENIPMSAIIF